MAINEQWNERPAPAKPSDIAILIVDDEAGIRDFLQRALSKLYREVDCADSTQQADLLRLEKHYDLLVVDICMPERSGVQWIQTLRDAGNHCDVIFMTAFADMNHAIDALRLGASDLILKPFRIEQMRAAIKKSLDHRRLSRENFVLQRQLNDQQSARLIGESSAIQALNTLIKRIAPAPSAVLLQGESGTGKELAARALHQFSGRHGAFVPVNCAALSPELMESELFGHVKGAFTNAHQPREGLFSYADHGTLFLDEISEMPLTLQAKLLRVLEDGRIRPLGTERDIKVDVRIIAASNKNLVEEVQHGHFREDLFYRLNVLQCQLPPLRERLQDLPILTEHLIQRLSKDLSIKPIQFSQADFQIMRQQRWPGNIRELKNLVERCLLLGMFPQDLLQPSSHATSTMEGYPLDWTLQQVECCHIERVLQVHSGNKTQAAKQLGITRKTLDRKRQQGSDERSALEQ
ncbi:sigma-54-dependent transcriptional regulator [Marinomonas fungiae]|uniref:Two component, sigma54 specific, transcriptional regulator, Fis family n=1 Tax=Marinomonas fungiae TaxID=1137284 RepID=A0A0K6IN12_9GAMM|nr:sigma-54 dependent transcriptional regulator [Marinomonas fungiae]CUB04505.1 two component, sigma54 specific, transcriptional regulator, Fis family [Marinomonas fungiae]